MNSTSGWSRLRAPTSATSAGSTVPESSSIRRGIPHVFPLGEVSGVFRSPCASNQTTARRPWRVASPSTAPTCEQQHPPRTSGRSGRPAARARFCSVSESSSTTAASGYGSGRNAASAIDSPSAPQARGTRTRPAANCPPAGVALVLAGLEGDGGERPAVGAAGPEARHRAQATASRPRPAASESSVVGQALEIGELGRPRQVARLVQTVDPDRGDAELVGGRDVVEEARRHVDVALGIGAEALVERLPVPVRGLVGADLAGDDRPVERDADRLHRGVEEVGIGVRERHEPPAPLAQLGQRRRAPRGRPASAAASRRARAPRPSGSSSPSLSASRTSAWRSTSRYGSEPSSCTRGSISW